MSAIGQGYPSTSALPQRIPCRSQPSAIKPPSTRVNPPVARWPIGLNQLASIALDDDSDLDRSFTDATSNELGSVRLLQMLKDSDDDDASAPSARQRRARLSHPSGLPQAKPLGGIPVARSSSLRNTSSSGNSDNQIPRPQMYYRAGGTIGQRPMVSSASTSAIAGAAPMRFPPAESYLVNSGSGSRITSNRWSRQSENAEDMEQIFSEAQALAQRLGAEARKSEGVQGHGGLAGSNGAQQYQYQSQPQQRPVGIPGPMRSGTYPGTSAGTGGVSGQINISAGAGTGSLLRKPTVTSGSSAMNKPRLSGPTATVPRTRTSQIGKQPETRQSPAQGVVAGPDRGSSSPTKIPGSPMPTSQGLRKPGIITPSSAQQQQQQQTQPSLSRMAVKKTSPDTTLSSSTLPMVPGAAAASVQQPAQDQQTQAQPQPVHPQQQYVTVGEMNEEVERWRIEIQQLRLDRSTTEADFRKQISDLERDLETALESLQSTEANAIASSTALQQSQQEAKVAVENMEERIRLVVEEERRSFEVEEAERRALESERTRVRQEEEEERRKEEEQEKEKERLEIEIRRVQDQIEEEHKAAIKEMQVRSEELDQKLAKALQENEQLETQIANAVPVDVQEAQNSLLEATQELEAAKIAQTKLKEELAQEKIKIAREQEDSGHLLLKINQLQDTISNQTRDSNMLKDRLQEHEQCQENMEAMQIQHKKECEQLQKETVAYQQSLGQEREQRALLEQSIQEHHFQSLKLQQQAQMQQTQLLQQQTEIVNLRAALEVEQKQSTLLQQQLEQEQRLSAAANAAAASVSQSQLQGIPFARRVSMDGDMSGSYLMIDPSSSLPPHSTGLYSVGMGMDSMVTSAGMSSAISAPVMIPSSASVTTHPFHLTGSISSGAFQSSSISAPFSTSGVSGATTAMSSLSMGLQGSKSTGVLNQAASAASALPPAAGSMNAPGGLVMSSLGLMGSSSTADMEAAPRIVHRGSAGSISGILAGSGGTGTGSVGSVGSGLPGGANRLSMHGDFGGSIGGSSSGANLTVEELTAQLHGLMKEKDKLEAELSKVPISGGGPMSRRKAEMLETQIDETERAIGRVRYSIRIRS